MNAQSRSLSLIRWWPLVLPFGQAAQSPGRSRVSAIVLDQHRLALEHHQELVLAVVPVALRRPGAGLEDDMADAEVGQPGGRGEPAVPAALHVLVERRGITGAVGLLDGVEIDLGHCVTSLRRH